MPRAAADAKAWSTLSHVQTKLGSPPCGYVPVMRLSLRKTDLRRDVFADRIGRIVVPARVTASATLDGPDGEFTAANLFDSSVTEDSCIDYWLLPERRAGFVDVTLPGLEPIAKVLILNTQNGGSAYPFASTRYNWL